MKSGFTVMLTFLAAFMMGLFSLLFLKASFYPELSVPYVCIVTVLPGASPYDVEKLVTVPLESKLASVRKVRSMISSSARGISMIRLRFDWDADMEILGSEIRNKVDSAYPYLPDAASRPVPVFGEVSDSAAMVLAIFPEEGRKISDISALASEELAGRLMGIEGVAQVCFRGVLEKEILAEVDYPSLMSVENIDLEAVNEIIERCVFSYPVGAVENHRFRYEIKGKSDIKTIADLERIPLNEDNTLLLGDIADISLQDKEKTSVFRVNGRECIGVELIKGGTAGLADTCRAVRSRLPELEQLYRNIFSVEILEDRSVPLVESMKELIISLITGIACGAGVIILLSGNRKAALVVTASLPLSLFPVFIFMYFKGITLNIISVSALTIGAGMVFDSSIVVAGRKKALMSVLGSTVTTIIVFLPLMLVSGIVGRVFGDLAFTVAVFLGVSCVTALLFSKRCFGQMKIYEKGGLRCPAVGVLYSRYFDFAVAHKRITAMVALVFLLPVMLLFHIRFELVPGSESERLVAQVCFPDGLSFGEYCRKGEMLEKELMHHGASVVLSGGCEPDDIYSAAWEYGAENCFTFRLEGIDERSAERILEKGDFTFFLGREKSFLQNMMGSVDEKLKLASGRYSDYLEVKASELSPHDVFRNMVLGTEGNVPAELEVEGVRTDIRVRYSRKYVDSAEKVISLMVKKDGIPVFTSPHLSLEKKRVRSVLLRNNRKPVTGVEEQILSGKEIRETGLLFAGALIFIWLALAFQFESLTDPLKVLALIPAGAGGSLLFLMLTGNSLNIGSLLGIMIMSGTAVNSGILVLEDIKEGVPLRQAAVSRSETVVLTVSSTLLALLPVAFTGDNPLIGSSSLSLAGGLLWGTLAFLVSVPLLQRKKQ